MIQGLLDAHARLELPLVESHSAAAPADDSGFGEKLFTHPMIRVPVTGAFYGNQGAHAAQVAAELARQRAGVDRVDASHDVAVREVHNEVMITQSFDDCYGVDLVGGSVQAGEGLAGGVGLILLDDLGVVLLVAALLVLLFTLWSDKIKGQMMTTKTKQKEQTVKKNLLRTIPLPSRIAQTELGTQEVQLGKWQGTKQHNQMDQEGNLHF